MAAGCTQEAILNFLRAKGGKVKNTDLVERFKAIFPEEPEGKAAARHRFKNHVDSIAFVKTERGVKYVLLKKRFRASESDSGVRGSNEEKLRPPDASQRDDAAEEPDTGGAARRAPGSGYGNDSQVRVLSPATILPDAQACRSVCRESVCAVEGSGEMGNRGSAKRRGSESKRQESQKQPVRKARDVPHISVIEASPLPAEATVFTLPGPSQAGATGRAEAEGPGALHAGFLSVEGPKQADGGQAADGGQVADGGQGADGGQAAEGEQVTEGEQGADGGQAADARSLSGSDGSCSPKGSRRHFIEVMMSSSPQLRRNMGLRNSVCLSARSDSDSASLASFGADEDRASVTLDPLEHEWMMCASDGEWASLSRLLSAEPGLLLRRDFVTGFTCLHWAAKHGKPELLAAILDFAQRHHVPVSVDVRSNTGYTPLHVAAMHDHVEVVKLLVGAFGADVEVRDYSGRKACQYLADEVSADMRDIAGSCESSESEKPSREDSGRWRFSKVLQSNLKPPRPDHSNAGDAADGAVRVRGKPARRKSSFGRMKPRLERLRLRTSQVVHSASFWVTEEQEESVRDSFRSRPKTHFLG